MRHLRALIFWLGACLAASASAQLQHETLTVAKLPAPTPHRLYITDISFLHIVDGRLHVVDGDALKYLGMLSTGYAGLSTLSNDGKEMYVATTYYSRLSRGERSDVVDIHDTQTLEHKGEIPIPPRHAQALPYKGLARVSSDGRWLLVQNATPASSVSVVDLRARKFAAEVATPGCWIIVPSQTVGSRFATLCGDGTLQAIELNDDGTLKSRKRSARFFDADADPVFVHSEAVGDRHYFVSFLGRLYAADLSGETPQVEPPWSLVDKADQAKRWRPGGYQLMAIHRPSKRLFVAMHPGGAEGSHKNPAQEIWVFDLETHQRLARLPGHNAIAMTISQIAQPKLFALDALKGGFVVYDAGPKPRYLTRMGDVGETPTLLALP